jgi:ribose transport system substrate-binding protein
MRARTRRILRPRSGVAVIVCALVGALATVSVPAQAAVRHDDGASSAVSKASAQIAKYSGPPKFVAPNARFSVKKLKGKTVAIVTITETAEALVRNIDGIKAGAKAAGVKVTLTNARTTPSLMTQGVQEAVRAHAGAIILVGIPAAFVLNAVKLAHTSGIPVVTCDDYQPTQHAVGQGSGSKLVYADADSSEYLEGELAADSAIIHWKGRVNAVIVNSEGLTQGPPVIQGFKKVLDSCATCHILATENVEIETWATKLNPLVGSLMKQYSNLNTLLPIFNDMEGLLVPAVKADGGTGKVIVVSTGASNTVSLVPAYPQVMVGYVGDNDYWNGWQALNQAMRGMLKLHPGNPTGAPPRFVTPKVVSSEGTAANALFGSSYIQGFKKLWELGK